ncbi:MAG TPA: glycosyltransferase family 4 protein [Candidatus Dormibacteraeota bacterium]|nr:glycosyltransferase family 4 protein [Candidatus Dormibacteraeota bacterium]
MLLVAPLPGPPLLGGIETGVKLLLDTELSCRVSMRLFNTARNGNPTRGLPRKLAFQVSACARFIAALLRVRPRIVHVKAATGINFFQHGLYAALARLFGRKVLLQLHAGDFPAFVEKAGPLRRRIIRFVLRLPHGLLALSPRWAEYFHRLSDGRPVAVIPNATLTEGFFEGTPDRVRFGIPADRLVLLFIATRDPRLDADKGLPDLLEAVKRVRSRHPNLMLVLAGRTARLEEISAMLGPEGDAWKSVRPVAGEEKSSLYRSADLFVLPSQFENMPNTVIEAMAAGLPVVATPVGAVPEMLDDGEEGFLVPAGAVDVLADRIDRLARDTSLRRRMGSRAGLRAAREFHIHLLERRLAAEYARLAPGMLPALLPVLPRSSES